MSVLGLGRSERLAEWLAPPPVRALWLPCPAEAAGAVLDNGLPGAGR